MVSCAGQMSVTQPGPAPGLLPSPHPVPSTWEEAGATAGSPPAPAPAPGQPGPVRGPSGLRGVTRGSVRGPGPGPAPRPGLGPGHGPGDPGQPFLRPVPLRPPFFIREIYKNGFLKRLPYNEKRSSALAKLMKSDRFWVVFSIHDDVHPFLELWHEPTEVASKPPQYIFPLVACQHISPSIIPADSEWSFVINFDTVAIRFSCNSRETMEDWVEVIRSKLSEMGILNPKGNLYSRAPLGPPVSKPVVRDPTSPLPQPPPVAVPAPAPLLEGGAPASPPQPAPTIEESGARSNKRNSLVLSASDLGQSFTTSIYLGPSSPPPSPGPAPARPLQHADSVAISSGQPALPSTSSVYLNQASPTRHVTVIPINTSLAGEEGGEQGEEGGEQVEQDLPRDNHKDNHTYGAIFDFDEKTIEERKEKEKGKEKAKEKRRKESGEGGISPSRRGRERGRAGRGSEDPPPPPLPHRPVLRRLSEHRAELEAAGSSGATAAGQGRPRRKSRRSSSLGPLLDAALPAELAASTLSLESVDSNPRQAVPRQLGAVPRTRHTAHTGSPPRASLSELPPGLRPPPYHPLATPHPPPQHPAFPPMIPLPGLTCQLGSLPPPGLSLPAVAAEDRGGVGAVRTVREQQVARLRREVQHPAGVRLQLRKKDCQSSLALVDLFGCVWVVGWKQRDYPVLFNAFHIGDQILSVSGVLIRSSNEFAKLVKLKSADLHTEIIIRRAPFAQVFHLKPEIEGQSLGIIPNNSTPEIKEIIPGSVASQAGLSAKIRSLDGQTIVPLVITEINGRPLNLFSRDGEAWERLAGTRDPGRDPGTRDLSIILQPADIVAKFKKQLKAVRGYKDYLLC